MTENQGEPRDLALEYLYATETHAQDAPTPPGRAGRLADGVLAELEDLDNAIAAVSEHWSVARMPAVDRNILRIGLYELRHEPGVPTAVILSEAVRMAETYSTERSSSFVNGILGTLAKNVRDG
ncbi:MAG: transcription antitermination factor NusB [Acidimicrobiia bacterium]|nr:transcription antitermination factor NusB [Acidimicrobiia bacterium]